MMTPGEIDALIERAGLRGVILFQPFAIRITGPTGYEVEPTSYEALAALLTRYGDERAAEMRERAAKTVDDHWPTGRASDMDTLAAAIRSLE